MKNVLTGIGVFLVTAIVLFLGTNPRSLKRALLQHQTIAVGAPYLLMVLAISSIVAIIAALLVNRL